MAKPILCEVCDKPATYSVQPDGGKVTYWCSEHYKQTVKRIKEQA